MRLRITLASNALHLEAARRLRRQEQQWELARPWRLEILVFEPARLQPRLQPHDRQLWPLRLPVQAGVWLLLLPASLLGLVDELWLSHLSGAGRGQRLVAARARRLVLLDDGLDQYRAAPRAVHPERFAAGTPCALFSDAPAGRAPWCRRFACRELGPLYPPPAAPPPAAQLSAALAGPPPAQLPAWLEPWRLHGTLIVDAPGLERLAALAPELPQPWLLLAHPVQHKRAWPLPTGPDDLVPTAVPEALIPHWRGTIVVGESITLLAALHQRPAGCRLLVALPEAVDANLRRMVADLVAADGAASLR